MSFVTSFRYLKQFEHNVSPFEHGIFVNLKKKNVSNFHNTEKKNRNWATCYTSLNEKIYSIHHILTCTLPYSTCFATNDNTFFFHKKVKEKYIQLMESVGITLSVFSWIYCRVVRNCVREIHTENDSELMLRCRK